MNWATKPQGQLYHRYSTIIHDTLAIIPGSTRDDGPTDQLDAGQCLLEGGQPVSYPRDIPHITEIKDSFHPLPSMNLLPVILQGCLC